MILHEQVLLVVPGGDYIETYAEVIPLTTREIYDINLAGGDSVQASTANYRIVLPPMSPADIPHSGDTIRWLGSDYRMLGPCLRHHVNGQLHHLEAIITRTGS